ncbi:MAG: VOC family protein [Anaerolineae bacterium]|nr:VOC family protein [Anaerolineae bacterium]
MNRNVMCCRGAAMLRPYRGLPQVMMPLDAYPSSAKFAWLSDRFGVSWQLSLPHTGAR